MRDKRRPYERALKRGMYKGVRNEGKEVAVRGVPIKRYTKRAVNRSFVWFRR